MNRKQTTPKEATAQKEYTLCCGSCAQKQSAPDNLNLERVSTFIRLGTYENGTVDLRLKTVNPHKKVTVTADILRMLYLALELETTKARRLSCQNDGLKKQLRRLGAEPEEPHRAPEVALPHYMDMDETVAMIGWEHYAGQPGMSVQAFLDHLLLEEGIAIGNHDFYAFLRREGYICKVDGHNVITEKADYMRILKNGSGKSPGQGIWVTASGNDYLRDRLRELHQKLRQAKPAQEVQV